MREVVKPRIVTGEALGGSEETAEGMRGSLAGSGQELIIVYIQL